MRDADGPLRAFAAEHGDHWTFIVPSSVDPGYVVGCNTCATGLGPGDLRATPPPPPLNVERLRRALEAEWPWHWRDDHDGTRRGAREAAEAVVARLALKADATEAES